MGIFDKFRNKLREELIRDIDIEVELNNYYVVLNIKEDCNLKEYLKFINKNHLNIINDHVVNNVLFDKNLDLIKSKKIFVFVVGSKRYNISLRDNIVVINERIHNFNIDEDYIDERRIEFDIFTNDFKVSRLKHNEERSTYYVKSYDSTKPDNKYFHLDESEAFLVAKDVFNNLEQINYIESIIDFKSIKEIILGKEFSSDIVIKKELKR